MWYKHTKGSLPTKNNKISTVHPNLLLKNNQQYWTQPRPPANASAAFRSFTQRLFTFISRKGLKGLALRVPPVLRVELQVPRACLVPIFGRSLILLRLSLP